MVSTSVVDQNGSNSSKSETNFLTLIGIRIRIQINFPYLLSYIWGLGPNMVALAADAHMELPPLVNPGSSFEPIQDINILFYSILFHLDR